MEYLPSFYYLNDYGHTRLAAGKGWIVIFIIFGVERLLVFAGLLIYAVVPEIPEGMMKELERRHFVRIHHFWCGEVIGVCGPIDICHGS